jgi:hypothetical protein
MCLKNDKFVCVFNLHFLIFPSKDDPKQVIYKCFMFCISARPRVDKYWVNIKCTICKCGKTQNGKIRNCWQAKESNYNFVTRFSYFTKVVVMCCVAAVKRFPILHTSVFSVFLMYNLNKIKYAMLCYLVVINAS